MLAPLSNSLQLVTATLMVACSTADAKWRGIPRSNTAYNLNLRPSFCHEPSKVTFQSLRQRVQEDIVFDVLDLDVNTMERVIWLDHPT